MSQSNQATEVPIQCMLFYYCLLGRQAEIIAREGDCQGRHKYS